MQLQFTSHEYLVSSSVPRGSNFGPLLRSYLLMLFHFSWVVISFNMLKIWKRLMADLLLRVVGRSVSIFKCAAVSFSRKKSVLTHPYSIMMFSCLDGIASEA